MLFATRSAISNWHLIFRQYPSRASLGRLSLRCSSSLPDKERDNIKRELTLPKEKWDPVAQKFLRRLPVEHHGIAPANFDDYTIWYPIYKFPYINMVHTFIRVKVYVTFISMSACLMKLVDILTNADPGFSYIALVSGVTLLGMTLAGNLCRKLIVQMYVTEDTQYVRLSRFTFFGKRLDIVLPKYILIHLADTNDTHRKLMLSLRTKAPENVDLTYDNYEFYDDKFLISLMFGEINDQEKFEEIFGKLLRRIH